MPPKETKQTPSNIICMGKGSQAGWGTDGKVHCFKPKSDNSGNTSSNPSGGFQSGGGSYSGKGGSSIVTHHEYPSNGYQGGNSSSYSGINTKGGSYSSPEQHIQQVCASLGGNVLGGAYHDGRKNRDKFGDGINYQVKGIVSQTNYYGFKNPKGIVLSDCALEDRDIAVLTKHLQCHWLGLDVFDVSNNKIGLGGVKNLFCGLRIDNPLAGRKIITMNFSNNVIGDDGAKYMADCLKMGRYPNLKSLDVSGNHITPTGEGHFVKAMQNHTLQHMYVTLKNAVGTKKDYYAPFLKQVLKDAQNNGVDIKNIVVDKSLIGSIKNNVEMGWNISVSFIKCKFVPVLEAPSLVADTFVLSYPKHAISKIFSPTETLACVFNGFKSEFDTDLGAKIAVRDLELMGVDEFIHTSE